ncbi:MAG: PEP-CTERM sorting domain-containing protein [Akkermansiaceae bacterium]
MKYKINRPAQWIGTGAIVLTSASASNAALMRIGLGNTDFTQSLDGSNLFAGISDAGQWGSGSNTSQFANVVFEQAGNRAFVLSNNVSATSGGSFYIQLGTSTSGFATSSFLTPGVAVGLIAWDLSDGTRGFLRVQSDGTDLVATHFVFDDEFSDARPELSVGGNGTQFDGATEFTGSLVPEPSSVALLALGAAGVMARRRRESSERVA